MARHSRFPVKQFIRNSFFKLTKNVLQSIKKRQGKRKEKEKVVAANPE
jgi:hypothetical protein